MKKHIFAIAAITLLAVSCGNKNEFSIKGNIEGAAEKTLVLENAVNGRWFIIDSVKTASNGDFELNREAPAYPEVYRLILDGKSIYFPVDSLENIELTTKLDNYGVDYTLAGSDDAVRMMEIDKKARNLKGNSIKDDVVNMQAFKRELAEQILVKPSSILSYYIINKYIGDEPLFDVSNSVDLQIIGAVANAYNTFKPNDPRTKFLVSMVLEGQRKRRAAVSQFDTVHIAETKLINIKLQDKTGAIQDLQEVAAKGNVVLLNFTFYSAEQSPLFNKLLSDIYQKNKARGFEIFQIGLDADLVQWKVAAQNLPWITVFDPESAGSRYLGSYNVRTLPTTFIIDRKGELVERVEDISQIESKIQKYL